MNEETAVEWLHRQGDQIIKTESSYWFNAGPRVYQAFPYHKVITPSKVEIRSLFRQTNAVAIRYSTPLNQPEGQISYHVIYDKGDYDISQLHKKARHDVTRGLSYATYEAISFDQLMSDGWSLREDTLIRQGRQNAETKHFWEKLCSSAKGLPGFETWGALHDGNLVTALFACTIGDTVGIFYQQSLTQHLNFGINNALTFVFTREVLNRPGIKRIFYGLHSLDAPPSVDSYKFRMGYYPKPVKQRVVFNPLIAPFIQPICQSIVGSFSKLLPNSAQMSKIEGMLSFYIQGKLPLLAQKWPDVLLPNREAIVISAGKNNSIEVSG